MKYKKIFNDIINDYYNGNDVIMFDLGDEILVSSRPEIIYFIPKDKFLLDIDKFKLSYTKRMEISNIIRNAINETDYVDASGTPEIVKVAVENGEEVYLRLSNWNDYCIAYIDKRLLSNFNNPEFKIKYEGNYVMVYEKSPKTGKYVRVASVETRLFCQEGN